MSRSALAAACIALVLIGLTATSSAKTLWLCRPGQRPDPCTPGLSSTVYSPSLKRLRLARPRPVAHPAIDCFYVYPTVSRQKTGNANRHMDPEENAIALLQAARYSQYCRMFAPMYRQVTLAGLGAGHPTTPPSAALALADVRAGFRTYLRRYNHGRGFVLIGHSQGSFMLRQLIARDIDSKPAVRQRLVSAILLGGDVLVKAGRDSGGDFKHIHACHSATQLSCAIAFSSFDQPVPADTLFGRPLPILGTSAPRGDVVLCTNPATLGGGAGLLDPILPRAYIGELGSPLAAPATVWASAPGSYRAHCSSAGGAHVLQITGVGGAPRPPEIFGAAFGLHQLDSNIAFGNLISIVRSQAGAFVRGGR